MNDGGIVVAPQVCCASCSVLAPPPLRKGEWMKGWSCYYNVACKASVSGYTAVTVAGKKFATRRVRLSAFALSVCSDALLLF